MLLQYQHKFISNIIKQFAHASKFKSKSKQAKKLADSIPELFKSNKAKFPDGLVPSFRYRHGSRQKIRILQSPERISEFATMRYSNPNTHSLSKLKLLPKGSKASYSSLKPASNRGSKSSEQKHSSSGQLKRAQLDHHQRSTCYDSFMRRAKKDRDIVLPNVFELIAISERPPLPDYNDVNMKILSYTNDQLITVSVEMLSKFGLAEKSNRLALAKLVREISHTYRVLPYHNFAHGFSLMHMFYHLTRLDRKFRALFTKEEIGFVLIAGLAHDSNHPGTNNNYEIKIKSDWASIASDDSVLEKMHVRTLFNLLKTKNIGILDKAQNPHKIKELIIRAILSTDVAKHFKNLERLKSIKESQATWGKNPEHRQLILEEAFHACDIGNSCLEYSEYINWAALITFEFDQQTRLEEANKLEVTQYLRYRGRKSFYEGQIGFINAFVYPLWKQLGDMWPGFRGFVASIEANREKLKQHSSQQPN